MAARITEPSARWGHAAAPVGDKVAVFGGRSKDFSEQKRALASTVHLFDVNSKTWTVSRTEEGPVLYGAACASALNEMFLYGGVSEGTAADYQGSLHHLNLSTLEWSQPSSAGQGPMRKTNGGMIYCDQKLIIFGGYGFPTGPTQAGAEFVLDTMVNDGSGWSNELHSLEEGEFNHVPSIDF